MRLLLGIVLGGLLTVAVAYLYDSSHALNAANAAAGAERPLVNWDVVNNKVDDLAERARSEWNWLRGDLRST